ncbi:uncharacterized protein SCHCODRAFT_02631776 [Schizophyllum commune H4-8]|uniref:uncharacterized protein n=1 Tax=Schizophyllum commune (strain H4-8 / FGSC 9210) TaxID=578458 RepID=UPI00215FDF01|nr:uncharacterized protein SCHCODRAFT_02631776 [Schizophyllum commune H4-8]KAI5890412.1 hypothetical protein SCHCODRAFT_02631776 [Schizophyllum commune H4-8]
MEDAFQFIIESPQTTTGHKKRPRLVTSCDNCRLKKIKCLQPHPDSKCDACKAAKIPCKFKDRERYFAERSRAIAGPNVGTAFNPIEERAAENGSSMDAFSISGPQTYAGSSSRATHSPKPSGAVAAESSSPRFQPYPSTYQAGHRHSTSSPITPSYPNQVQGGYNYVAPTPAPVVPQRQPISLFDQDNQNYPNRTLITEFTEAFIRNHVHQFQFVNSNDIWKQVWSGTLPAPFASCIAALACKHSTRADLTYGRTIESVGEVYAENAKNMLGRRPAATMPMLHTLILLAWAEQRLKKDEDARMHYDMAMRMAVDLGMTNSSINLIGDQRDIRVLTWSNLVELHHALVAR